MKPRTFEICPEGISIITTSGFCAIFFVLINFYGISFIFFVFTLFSIYFFRDPSRFISCNENEVVSPADGKVIFIGKGVDPITGDTRLKISIFMNLFSVHVNRSPIQGEIKRIIYKKGKFFNASFDKASEHNERNMILIKTKEGDYITVVQIAGLIARRIVCWIEEGDKVKSGERIGLIKFGSRVDLYLPEDYKILVSNKEKVFAGESLVATKNKREE